MIVSFGYFTKIFRLDAELKKDHNVLYLRDPYGFLFYKGLDNKGTQADVEKVIRDEINFLKPKKTVFVSLCISGFLAMALGFKLCVDAIVSFSPWTNHKKEYMDALYESCKDDKYCLTNLLYSSFANNAKVIEELDPICDINNWENVMGPDPSNTKLILFFNQNRLDQISLNHINQSMREKISIINIKAGETNRQTIRSSIIENIDFLSSAF